MRPTGKTLLAAIADWSLSLYRVVGSCYGQVITPPWGRWLPSASPPETSVPALKLNAYQLTVSQHWRGCVRNPPSKVKNVLQFGVSATVAPGPQGPWCYAGHAFCASLYYHCGACGICSPPWLTVCGAVQKVTPLRLAAKTLPTVVRLQTAMAACSLIFWPRLE